ncbi:DegT/DnrJ/EryC1/StrS family aminotransferase [Rickettsia endosymbiont of Halotydeus destructor]|uniref:DegT/DnrJ/EryC1/StrS family aminotransferase n=1 Tax=Rickettsia endosymbiont of Halotydeus destructor TaxID=2996754 RepID=UPI003BAE5740
MIPVTKPYLPPIDQYIGYVKKIWQNEQLTNAGPFVLELESKLKNFFKTDYCFFLSNGTIALQIAIKALNLTGEIITTPFSYVATTSSIAWEGCKPIFVDIESDSLTIDPKKIEAAITAKTTAIIATHVYGNPCDVENIEKIACSYGIKVIYDAAHCFGVEYKNIPLVNYGDISTLSFHATKLFQTIEGGAIITSDKDIAHKSSYLRNFGHNGAEDFFGIGINGKNSELHAAMGLCNLPVIFDLIAKRKELSELYDSLLLINKEIIKPLIREGTTYNYAYYPIILPSQKNLLEVTKILNNNNIFARRYFYPSLSTLNYVEPSHVPISLDISERILCLPLYNSLTINEVEVISRLVLSVL